MEKDVFKSWQTQLYHTIKKDYPSLWNDSDDDTDVGSNFETNENDILDLFGSVPPLPSNTSMATAAKSTNNQFNLYVSNRELKEILLTIKDAVGVQLPEISANSSNSTGRNTELNDFLPKIRDYFQFVICLESNFASVSFFYICGRFLGCCKCAIHSEKCAISQKDFNVKYTSCSSVINVPRNANIVPGLSTLLTENEATTEASNQDPTNS